MMEADLDPVLLSASGSERGDVDDPTAFRALSIVVFIPLATVIGLRVFLARLLTA